MTKTPLLSVFIPTYNGASYVREALESVIDNGFADLEIVVLDDGSTDATVEIVESMRHPAVRLARNPRNLGVVETRRRGVALLQGRHVALLDQDDLAVAGRFQAQVDRLETAGGPDIIGGAIESFGDYSGIKHFYCIHAEIRASLLFNASIANPAACMKLAPLRDGTIAYSVEAGPAADYALWVDAMLAGLRLENLDRVVTRYRRHAASMTQTGFGDMVVCAARVRKRVADLYFPEMSEVERLALVTAISGRSESHQNFCDGIHALARAALVVAGIPAVDEKLMRQLLSDHAMRLITDEIKCGRANFELLEQMVEDDACFEQWRAADNGALDMRIMALFS
jgi:glycosyltransferase involved in cell wall biosynthesis